jgi:hypothetical protein
MTADHKTWVPHLRGVLVFAAKVGYHQRKPTDVIRKGIWPFYGQMESKSLLFNL